MFDEDQIPVSRADIAIWGPTGSGKTWLISAFAKELEWYSEKDPNFKYELVDEDGVPIIPKPPEPHPTSRPNDVELHFRRIPKVRGMAQIISSHAHRIIIHDDKGSNLVAASIDGKAAQEAYQKLINARYIIIVLDATFDLSAKSLKAPKTIVAEKATEDIYEDLVDENDGTLGIATRGDLSSAEYRQLVQNLFNMLAGNPPRPDANGKLSRHIAICLTKTDMSTLKDDPWQLLGRIFDQEMLSLVRLYAQTFPVKVFQTSSAGTYREIGEKRPNFDVNTGKIQIPQRWDPYNAAAPFFWIFETNERERLEKKSGKEKYIGYTSR